MSIKIKEIAYSCYVVTDFIRSRAFYEQTLGLKNTMLFGEPGGPHWAEYDLGAGTLAIGAGAPGMKPSPDGCVVALEVEDFEGAVADLRAKNVAFRFGPFETPVCHMVGIIDPDNNSIIIHHRKS